MGSQEDPPITPRLVSKQVLDPKEPVELTAFLPTLEFEGKFSPGFGLCFLCVCSDLYRLHLGSTLVWVFLRVLVQLLVCLLFGTRLCLLELC